MRLESLDVFSVEIPMKRAFAHNLNTHRVARPQLVRATLSNGITGWGEAQPRDYVTGETIDSVHAAVHHVADEWRGVTIDGLESAAALLRTSPLRESDPAALCGVELALLDAAGKLEGRNVTALLGSVQTDSLPYDGAVLGFLPMPVFGMALGRVNALGKSLLKLKVGRDDDETRIALARRVLGSGIRLVLDANGAWTADEAIAKLTAFAKYGIDAVEQPVAREDIDGLARVRSVARVIADESLCTMSDAQRLVGKADAFNVRIGKCGGLLATKDLIDFARSHDIDCHLGVMVGETTIAATAGRLLAACIPSMQHLEFDESNNATFDVTREPLAKIANNRAPVPELKPGLGYELDLHAIEARVA